MRLELTISIMLILSGCAASQKQKLPGKVEVPVTKTAEPLEIVEYEPDTQLEEDKRERIITLFDDALAQMEYAPQNAIQSYKELIQLAPDIWEVYYNLGIIYIRQHDMERAIEELLTALKHKAPPAKVYNSLGIAYMITGKNRTAVKIFRKALGYERSPAIMINVANMYQTMDKTEKAIKYYDEVETIEPSSQMLHYNIGALLYKKGDYKEAQAKFSKALTYGKRDKRILLSHAHTLLKLKEYEAALKVFQEITDKEPSDPASYREMGIIYEVYLGDMEKALDSYTNYIEKGGEKKEEVEAWIDVIMAKLELKES